MDDELYVDEANKLASRPMGTFTTYLSTVTQEQKYEYRKLNVLKPARRLPPGGGFHALGDSSFTHCGT